MDHAIRSFQESTGDARPVRIDIHSTGCCDSSLFLRVDSPGEDDLTLTVSGLTFVISLRAHRIAGDVTITLADGPGREGFLLTSSRPLSEWEGFSPIRITV